MDPLPSPRLARKASSIPPSLNPVLKSLGLEEEDPEEVFEIHSKEGAGAFGRVFRATYRRDPSKVAALKVIPVALEAGQRGEDIENVRREIQFLRECDHPNVVAFFGAYYKDSALWVAMEYCGGGSVGDVSRRRRLEEDEIAVIMRGALQGLAYLHSRKKIHRDIKGGNILLTSDGMVKIADFGVSAQLKDTMSRRGTFVGTPYWMSPEMIQDSDYDYKSDIWSLGITMIELADQKPPLFDEHPMRVLIQIPRNPPPSVKQPQSWTPLFCEFLQFCLQKDPKERPGAVECLDHAFIQRVAGVASVYAEGSEARGAMVAAAAVVLREPTQEELDELAASTDSRQAVASSLGSEDSDATADDVTLKASAARPARPAIQKSDKPQNTQATAAFPSVSETQVAFPSAKEEEEAESDVGTPRNSESVVEDAWDPVQSAAITSSRSSRSDGDDDDETTDGNDAIAEGFAFRQRSSHVEPVAVPTEESAQANSAEPVARREVLEPSMNDDQFEVPAMALISKIHAAANTLAGQSLRVPSPPAPPPPLPVPLQAAPSPILRSSKKNGTDSLRFQASEPPAPAIGSTPRRDVSSFSKYDSFNRNSQTLRDLGKRDYAQHVEGKRSHDHAHWSNPLADLTAPSHDRVNSLLSSISASSLRLPYQLPQSSDSASSIEFTPPRTETLRGSAMSRMGIAPSATTNTQFIGSPFRVSHQMCVKYNTLDAKFEGAPQSSEWATIHRQFGIPLAQMHCRTNARDHVPALLHMLRRELVKQDGLDCKHIYRVSPEQSTVLHAKQAINGGVFDAATVNDPHVFASLIKHWLRELPTPLLAMISRQDLASAVTSLVKPEDQDVVVVASTVEFARPFADVHTYVTAKILDKLPAPERGVVLWLVDHMIEVMDKSSRNGMTAQSLAVVMAPNVYRWASATPADASLISRQVATLLRVLLAWRQQCQGSSSSMMASEDGARSSTVKSRPSGRGGETALSQIAWTGAKGSTTSVRDSLNVLREMPHDSTVSGLLRRSSLANGTSAPGVRPSQDATSHFVSASTVAHQTIPMQASGSAVVPLATALRELVDSLWSELPQSLLLLDKPPIVRSLHVKFQSSVLTAIIQNSKRDSEQQWSAQLMNRINKHLSIDATAEMPCVPMGLRSFSRWLQAALSVDAFVKLLEDERRARDRLESHWPKRKHITEAVSLKTAMLAPEQAFSISCILKLGAAMANHSSQANNDDDGDSSSNEVLLGGAATFVRAMHGSPVESSRVPVGVKAVPIAEEIAWMGKHEPVIGNLLEALSGEQMQRYHLECERRQEVAMVTRAMSQR